MCSEIFDEVQKEVSQVTQKFNDCARDFMKLRDTSRIVVETITARGILYFVN